MKWRRFWKGFFYAMVILTVGGFALRFFVPFEDHGEMFEELVWLPLNIAQLVGLFGFAYSRAIGTRRIWKMILGATVLEAAWVLFSIASDAPPSELGSWFFIAIVGFIVVLLALLCVGLYSYAFRATELWLRAT